MVQFVGGSHELRRKKADTQRSVNLFVADVESGAGKSAQYLKAIPGLRVFSAVPPVVACDLALEAPSGLTLRLQMLFDGDFSDSSGNFPDFDSHPFGTISTDIKMCGSGSLHLPNFDSYAHLDSGGSPPNYGTGDGIPFPGDFVVRCFVYPSVLGAVSSRATVWTGRNVSDAFMVNYVSFGIGSNGMYCRLNNTYVDVIAGSFSTGQWYEVEWSRVGSTITMKQNRVALGTGSNSFVNDANAYGSFGWDPIQGNSFRGYVDSFSVWTE